MKDHRRGFVRHCLGMGASLGFTATAPAQAAVQKTSPPDLSPYERALSESPNMDLLGNPRSWHVVSKGLHPFAPQRTAILPGRFRNYGNRCGRDLRREIDNQIESEFGEMEGFQKKWFPDQKRESIYWMMERISDYYGDESLFREFVVGLAGREILASTAWGGAGFAHQFQRGDSVAVDNPPVDWWLFLMPAGYDWRALDDQPIYAVMCHVFRGRPYSWVPGVMFPIYLLTQDVWRNVADSNLGWQGVARMGLLAGCRHLNQIVARCLPENYDRSIEKH